MNSCTRRTTIQLLFVLLLMAAIAAGTQLAYAQAAYDEIPVDMYSNTPEFADPYFFHYVLEEGTELGWELESDNSSRLFDLMVFNDLDDILGSEIVIIGEVSSNSSRVTIPSSGYWYVIIRRARLITDEYTVHVTGKIWQDGTEVPTSQATTATSPLTTTPTDTPTSGTTPLIPFMLMLLLSIGVVIVIIVGYLYSRRDWGSGEKTLRNMPYYSNDEWVAIIKVIDKSLGSQDRVVRYRLRDDIQSLILKGDLDVPFTKAEGVIQSLVASGLIIEHEDLTLSLSKDYEAKKKEILPSS